MTHPTKPLDIEARELLARQLEVGLYHDDAERIKVAQDGLGSICAASAIAAISELLTRLREVEDSEKDWKRRAGLHSRQTSNTQERLDKMRIERNASQALLEDAQKQRDEALCRLLSAGSEKPTAEDMDWAISMSASLRRKEIAIEQTETEKLKALLEECRGALKPFAIQCNDDLKFYESDVPLRKLTTLIDLTVGDLRRAASLIEKLEGMG